MLAVKGLNQFYGGSHTLWDVDLDVPAGSRMCLMGRNGMGKTTLLKCIMGLQAATSGSIMFDGSDLLPGAFGDTWGFALQDVIQKPGNIKSILSTFQKKIQGQF